MFEFPIHCLAASIPWYIYLKTGKDLIMRTPIVNIIQTMLAPGIMISACALLLLGVNNKYSMVIDRIRALQVEKRQLNFVAQKTGLTEEEKHRLNSVVMQLKKFTIRFKIIKNILISYASAIAFFITSSFLIGVSFLINAETVEHLCLSLFLMGMLSVLIGIIHVVMEALQGYDIVMIEIDDRHSPT